MQKRSLLPALAAATAAATAASLLLGTAFPAAAQTPAPAAATPLPPGPPFEVTTKTPHGITMTVDTSVARDVLTLLTERDKATAALARLRDSAVAERLLAKSGSSDYFGRLVSAVAGTPDPVLTTLTERAPLFREVLDFLDGEGRLGAELEALRLAQILPDAPPVSATYVLVPFFGLSGYDEVESLRDGDRTLLVTHLSRLLPDTGNPTTREVALKALRAATYDASRGLVEAYVKSRPAYRPAAPDLDALLAVSVADGAPTLFLIPEEFFPLSPFLEEPITRAFARWNFIAERLLEPKVTEKEKGELLAEAMRGDFWRRAASIVGAQIADTLLRKPGRAAYVKALAEGPRAVALLYDETVKGTKKPAFSKAVRKALASPPPKPAAKG
ncbi:MAG: hypothetical protein JNK60_16570 [Acidobacteria bacterium]|nr:hypothetical protein [Acidobacteriota bacterium]